jgi:hypothetical protein
MNMIVKLLVMAALVFGFHYGVKRLAANAVGEHPQPVTVEVDPAALQRSIDIGRAAEPNPAARAVVEDAQRRIDALNRTMPLNLPMPHH